MEIQDLTYEQAFAEMERILQALEEEALPLEESIRLFEQGQALARRCAQLLDQAELRIQTLLPSTEE